MSLVVIIFNAFVFWHQQAFLLLLASFHTFKSPPFRQLVSHYECVHMQLTLNCLCVLHITDKNGNEGCDSEVWNKASSGFISTMITLKLNTQHLTSLPLPTYSSGQMSSSCAQQFCFAPVQRGHTAKQIKCCNFSKIQNPSQHQLTRIIDRL